MNEMAEEPDSSEKMVSIRSEELDRLIAQTEQMISRKSIFDEGLQNIQKNKESAAQLIEEQDALLKTIQMQREEHTTRLNNFIGEAQKTHEEALNAINEYRRNLESIIKEITDLKTASENSVKSIKENLAVAIVDTKAIAQEATSSKTSLEKISSFLVDANKQRDDAIALTEKIKKDGANVAGILKNADLKDKAIDEFKSKLSDLIKDSEELKNKINDLLPGAVSASLAKAFADRKREFGIPKIVWAVVQLVSVFGLLAVGFYLLGLHLTPTTLQEWFLSLVKKSPIILALILLEEIARRNYNVAERLEEDYGYKAVLASSFTGYRDQMAKIDKSSSETVTKLSNNLLESLGKEPGKLIDKVRGVRRPFLDIAEQVDHYLKKEERKENEQ